MRQLSDDSVFSLILRLPVSSAQADGPTIYVSLLGLSSKLSLSYSSWKVPLHRIMNQFRRKLCKHTIRIVTGSDMIAKGSEWTVQRSIIIHSIDPRQKDTKPMRKQRKVPLVLSNLLKQERNSPGKSTAEMGSQAQRRQSSWVMVGMTMMMGFWKRLMMQLLQDILMTQCTKMPTVASITSKLRSMKMPTDSDCIFSSFIRAMIEQIAMMSLITHCPFDSQYSGMNDKPTECEITSIMRSFLQILRLQLWFLVSQISSEMQTPTPAAPTTLPTTWAATETTAGMRQPRISPARRRMLKRTTMRAVILQPKPQQDQALLCMALRVSVSVAIIISMRSPISMGLQGELGSQSTKYWRFPSEVSTSIQLISWRSDCMLHWLLSTISQLPLGLQDPQLEMDCHFDRTWQICTDSETRRQLLWELSGRMKSSGIPQEGVLGVGSKEELI